MIRAADLSIEKNTYGAYAISALVNGYRVSRQFYGYTKKESIRRFLDGVNNKERETK